ncbi:ABC transporter ATP-binding protein [Lawsonibacter sp. OA9]|uniref:ABC transporter ATP-binding protein n=1 Tax=Lawsonibacter sp. OA9 TaxID=2914163 RepID=UPI001DEA587F|nr:ABC transporter ATP-binding protein [Lawsonibacter sp. OA9]MBS5591524.1 ABC transporter ATP-binding protein [Clostridiales bacterium]MCH1980852.1 ABC transporter ATP-binding protein [Lawsonibacter sp. OA9]
MASEYVIEMKGITKTFGSVVANKDVDLTLRQGEILALLGENGSGKTTLMNMLSGIYQPDRGQILMDGIPVTINSPEDSKRLGIGMVHQHFKLVDVFSAADNIWMGKEKAGIGLNRARYGEIGEMAKKFGFDIDPRKKVRNMAVSEKQTLEIIKVLYYGAKVIILDEPTAVLTVQEIDKLFAVLRKMKEEGHSIIIITHKLNEVMDISDRVAILRKGEYITTVDTAHTNEQELTEWMVGRKIDLNIERPVVEKTRPLLEVRDLTIKNDEGAVAIDKVSFYIRGGEILGVAGIAGCGQKELCEAIAGLRPIQSGLMIHKGDNIVGLPPKAILEKGISMSFIPEDRLGMGLAPSMSITDNMLLKNYGENKGPFVDRKAGRAAAQQVIEQLGVVTPSTETPVRRLSGGNVQKVLLGREIKAGPNVLITAYPVRGLDINSSYAIYHILNQQKQDGVGILFVGEDLDVMLALCDKIMVLCHGKVMGVVHAHKTTKEELGLMMTGALDLTNKYENKPAGIARDTNITDQELRELEAQEDGGRRKED